jgi:phenylacetate-CoA ligase
MKPFYHEYESWSETKRQHWIRNQLNNIITYATSHSKYYSKTFYTDLKLNINDEYPLANYPLLTSDVLRKNIPPINNNLLTSNTHGYTVFQSGGTTGTPKTSLFTYEEMEAINQCNLRGFHSVGLSTEDRVANLWAVGGLYMTFIHINRMLQQYGCTSFPFSTATPIDFITTVAQQFQINVFTGITSVVLNALREIHKKQPAKLKIDKIFYGGEHIYPNDRKEMEELFGVKIIKAPGYGTVDSWYLGYQCLHTSNGLFHAFDDHVYLEIIDESSGKHCAQEQIGMLYVTVFERKLTPIIRFQVGDRARWLKQSCSCGRTTPLFELLGRGDDILRIGYDSIDYNSVQLILLHVPGASGRMQIEKKRKEGRDQLIIRVETAAPEKEHSKMTQVLSEKFMDDRPSFREFLKKETVWPLQVEWLKEGALPQNSRTGKLVRVIDAI